MFLLCDDSGSCDDEEEEDDDEEEDMSEREAARMLEQMRIAEEDEEFERAFRALVQESVESVKTVGSAKNQIGTDRMAIPAELPKPQNLVPSRFRSGSAEDEDLDDDYEDSSRGNGHQKVIAILPSNIHPDTPFKTPTNMLINTPY